MEHRNYTYDDILKMPFYDYMYALQVMEKREKKKEEKSKKESGKYEKPSLDKYMPKTGSNNFKELKPPSIKLPNNLKF